MTAEPTSMHPEAPGLTQVGLREAARGFGEIRSGSLGVRLAESRAEVDAAQALRFRVFYEELGATCDDALAGPARRDRDGFDQIADHLLVIDHAPGVPQAAGEGAARIVGTYRLIPQDAAHVVGRFYSASEYDIAPLLRLPGNLLELGRSCVDEGYRNRAVMQLMWRGIAAYVFTHRIDLMFGCASLPGTDPDRVAPELTYLHHHHLAPPALRPRALGARYVDMRRMDPARLDLRRVQAGLPPLIKGYLRLGGFVGDGAVIDAAFNTIDVAVVVKTALVTEKYFRHYERALRDEGGQDGFGRDGPPSRHGLQPVAVV